MEIERAKSELMQIYGALSPDKQRAIDTLVKIEPCEDCVSRAELKKWLDMNFSFGGATRKLELFDRLDKELPPVMPKPKTGQFAEWVATEIFSDMWEYNKDTFAEIACRKLTELGIVRAKGDEWELVEPQERE